MKYEENGCLVFSDDEKCLTGLNPHITETDSCPCVNCLVKMVCEEECEDFIKYLTLRGIVKMESDCKGCKMFEKEGDECGINVIPYKSEVGHCPCKTCLIKGICERECDDFKQYKHDIGRTLSL